MAGIAAQHGVASGLWPEFTGFTTLQSSHRLDTTSFPSMLTQAEADGGNLSLPILHQEKQQATNGYFFLAADLAATAALFFWLALFVAAFFCPDFFWLAFGDLSPITLFFLWIDCLRHEIFSEGKSIVRCALMIVNGGDEFIWDYEPR